MRGSAPRPRAAPGGAAEPEVVPPEVSAGGACTTPSLTERFRRPGLSTPPPGRALSCLRPALGRHPPERASFGTAGSLLPGGTKGGLDLDSLPGAHAAERK